MFNYIYAPLIQLLASGQTNYNTVSLGNAVNTEIPATDYKDIEQLNDLSTKTAFDFLISEQGKSTLIAIGICLIIFIVFSIIAIYLMYWGIELSSTTLVVFGVATMITSLTIIPPVMFTVCGMTALRKKKEKVKRKVAKAPGKYHSIRKKVQ